MGVSIDLARAHASHHYGEIIAVFTWVNDERALVLLPAYRKGAPWFVVMESASFKYDNPVYLARMSAKAAEVLGMEEAAGTAFKIANIIIEGLPDLIRMPSAPEPQMSKAAYGNMELRADGETIARQDIHLEHEGVTYGPA